mmetsp:Transcript_17517/g.39642  ORF Transcript_17517/g.39642 Transcript_17517/m.39642 type:complete len:276 (-) Transcript_17517:207-1034(-)
MESSQAHVVLHVRVRSLLQQQRGNGGGAIGRSHVQGRATGRILDVDIGALGDGVGGDVNGILVRAEELSGMHELNAGVVRLKVDGNFRSWGVEANGGVQGVVELLLQDHASEVQPVLGEENTSGKAARSTSAIIELEANAHPVALGAWEGSSDERHGVGAPTLAHLIGDRTSIVGAVVSMVSHRVHIPSRLFVQRVGAVCQAYADPRLCSWLDDLDLVVRLCRGQGLVQLDDANFSSLQLFCVCGHVAVNLDALRSRPLAIREGGAQREHPAARR